MVFLHNAILLCMSGMNKTRWMKVDIKQFLDYVCITNREFFWKDLLLFNKKIYNNSEWNMKHVDFLLLVIPFKKTYKVQRRQLYIFIRKYEKEDFVYLKSLLSIKYLQRFSISDKRYKYSWSFWYIIFL